MEEIKGKKKRPIIDLIYSFVAYALPTFALQFVILPLLAGKLTPDENGLFLALFNAARLCVSLFIVPLANIRLLKKKECNEAPELDRGFNFIFATVVSISSVILLVLAMFYYGWSFGAFDMIRLIAVLVLIAAHDYFSITFRININYKSILIDNLMIVVGYAVGIFLMFKLGYWELVFISGYIFGLVYTLIHSKLWRAGIKPNTKKSTVLEYCQLSASSGLNNATTYCDKMLIFPLIGGYSVSVYNAAAVVSKMMTLISVPLRNVLLSYIVDSDGVSVSKKKLKKLSLLALGASVLIYAAFYGASVLFCRILYSQYFDAAMNYIPIILLAILFETYTGVLKIYLLRFEKTALQLTTSGIKVGVYLLCVVLFDVVFNFGLIGFCISILLADSTHFAIVLIFFLKNINKKQVNISNEKYKDESGGTDDVQG